MGGICGDCPGCGSRRRDPSRDGFPACRPPPRQSKLVAEVLAIRPRLRNAVVVSDISLQWLEIYAGGERNRIRRPQQSLCCRNSRAVVTEYHLRGLYDKKSEGLSGQIPPILLPGGELDPAEARKLAEEDKKGRPVYLLVMMPQSDEWWDELEQEFAEIDRHFSARNGRGLSRSGALPFEVALTRPLPAINSGTSIDEVHGGDKQSR